jgi:hypothetical protein
MPPSTMQDLLTQVNTDAAAVTADGTTVVADQAKLTADQATEATDTLTLTSDQATFSAALALSGPFAEIAPDSSSVTIYSSSSTPPGYQGQVIPVGSAVPIPTPPAPAAGS